MADAITTAPFAAGLTNQKLALVGLAMEAAQQGRPLRLPDWIEYVPSETRHPRRPFKDIASIASALAGLRAFGVDVVEGDAEPLDPVGLLADAGEALAVARRGGDAARFDSLCRLLAAVRPSAPIADAAEEASDWLTARGVITGCQLRIERDWLHWVELHRADDRIEEGERLYLTAAEVMEKLAATFGAGPVYATCNEADLPEPAAAIRASARDRHGIELIFRSEMPRAIGWAGQGALAGAALDFAIAGALPVFVGHTRSTFFNALALTAHGAGAVREHWLYNNRGDDLRRRTDHGAFVRPWAATNG